MKISTIRQRSAFVRMNAEAARFVVAHFILQMQEDVSIAPDALQVGYTVTKKLGGAVTRNRIKRRLREAARKTLPRAKGGRRYVFIARHKALECDFAELVQQMEFAISRIKTK